MVASKLTPRMQSALHHLRTSPGVPSRRSLVVALGLRSRAHVDYLLAALKRRGLIEMVGGRPRLVEDLQKRAALRELVQRFGVPEVDGPARAVRFADGSRLRLPDKDHQLRVELATLITLALEMLPKLLTEGDASW